MKVIVVMPAYNAEATLEKTFRDIPAGLVSDVILVDDHSRDRTVEVARRLGIKVIIHHENRGYGGNQKTCYREALAAGADLVVMIHPDYQYDARLTGCLIEPILKDVCDVMLGSRIRTRAEAISGGMPPWKYVANRGLTLLENLALGQNLGEFHSGFRAFRRRVLETLPLSDFSDDFVFDQEILFAAVAAGFRIGDVPVPARYFPEASSINFRRSLTYGFAILGALGRYALHRAGLRRDARFLPLEAGARAR